MSEPQAAKKEKKVEQNTGDKEEGDRERERNFEPRPKNTTKLQIKNLHYGTTKEDLNELCRRFGSVTALEVKGTNGFVTFAKADEASLAIHKLEGCLLFFDFTLTGLEPEFHIHTSLTH